MSEATYWAIYIPFGLLAGFLLGELLRDAYDGKILWLNRAWDACRGVVERCINWALRKVRHN